MKKFFFLATVAIAALATAFVSCDSDKDDIETKEQADVNLYYKVSKDLLEFADVTFAYSDFTGKTETIKVTNTNETSKLLTSTTSKSAVAKVKVVVEAKENFKPEDGRTYSFAIDAHLNMYVHALNSDVNSQSLNRTILPDNNYGTSVTTNVLTDEMLKDYKKSFTFQNEVTLTVKDGKFVE